MASLIPNIKQKFFDANGVPLAGGSLYSYAAGTSTPLATYVDQSAITPNANPTILDSSGQADIWLGALAYKFILKDSLGNTIWTVDNVSSIYPGQIQSSMIANGAVGTAQIADLAVTSVKLADNSVIASKLADNSVIASKIPAGSVGFAKFTNPQQELFLSTAGNWMPRFSWSAPAMLPVPPKIGGTDGLIVSWSADGKYLAESTVGKFLIWKRNGTKFLKIDDTYLNGIDSSNITTVTDIAWSPDGDYLAICFVGASSTYLAIYQKSGSYFIRLANYTTGATPGDYGVSVAWSPDSQLLALSCTDSPYIKLFQRVGYRVLVDNTFDRLTDPSSLPSGPMRGLVFSPDGTLLIGSIAASPYIVSYSVSGTTFTKLSNPATLPLGQANNCAISPDGTILALANKTGTADAITLYSISGTTLTKLTNPASLPPGVCNDCKFSSDGSQLAFVGADVAGTSAAVTVYAIGAGPTFTKIANPATLPAGPVNSCDWSPDTQFLSLAHDNSPYITTYQTAAPLPTNAILYAKGFGNA